MSRHFALIALAVLAACDGGRRDLVLSDITSPTGPGAQTPSFYSAPDGRVVMSWQERTADSTLRVRVSIRETNGTWSQPRTVTEGRDLLINWADFPSVVMLADGRLVAHWLQRTSRTKFIYDTRVAESNDAGGNWSASALPHREGVEAEHGFVSILPTGNGSARIFFLDGSANFGTATSAPVGHEEHGTAMSLSVNTWAPGINNSTKTVIDARVCDCCQTTAAMTSNGPVIVYRDRSDAEIRDITILREVNGVWTEPARVHADDWTIPGCPVNGPSVVAEGSFVAVAWFTGARDTAKVQVAFSTDAGATFGAPIRIDEGTPLGRVAAQFIGEDVAVSWLETVTQDSAAVRIRRVRRDGTAEAPITVGMTAGSRASGFPRMARAGNSLILAFTRPGSPSEVQLKTLGPAN